MDGRSDIYSLGIVFYELLTGRRPFDGTCEQILGRIEKTDVIPPRQLAPSLPIELERICLKAAARQVRDRYSTAADMAADLRLWLTHNEEAATSKSASEQLTVPVAPHSSASINAGPRHVVPRGLRSFDAHDADFFLDLLPGPHERDGLPRIVHFWKTRLECTNPEQTFPIGLLYGPSGCGKSSLIKAGLLPLLQPHVLFIYIDATPEDTEARMLRGLKRVCPGLDGGLGLVGAVNALRQGHGLPNGQKVVIVLDQFEQWLHVGRSEENRSLIGALRHCDGERLQALVLVRDDFWMAVTRFFRDDLEVSLREDENSAAVDLFDLRHSHKVLASFGRAYNALPVDGSLNEDQAHFLDAAVEGLAEEGRIIPVRLALFAEMVKARPWLPDTLRAIGGVGGVGVTFLEETFSATTAPPTHRLHQHAIRAVLRALLPEAGSDIKGQMQPMQKLLEISGYAARPRDFDELVRILDSELRLITPTEPDDVLAQTAEGEGSPTAVGSRFASDGVSARYYQLTHDFLVPTVREWLARKQKETRRGRAELQLVERSALWRAKPEQRQLPSLTEWLSFRLMTSPRTWTETQQQMMRAARRKHLALVMRLSAVMVVLACIGFFARERLGEERSAAKANDTVRRLLDADIVKTPAIIDDLAELRQWTDPKLREVVANPTAPREHRLHARLALLPVDRRQVDGLQESLLGADPPKFEIIRDALLPYRDSLVEALWSVLESSRGDPQQRFRAAAALAAYDPSRGRWNGVENWTAEQLVMQQSKVRDPWVVALRPVKDRLVPTLLEILRARTNQSTPYEFVANTIGGYASDQTDILVDAIARAPVISFPILLSRLQARSDQTAISLTSKMDCIPTDGGAAPNESASQLANLAIALLCLNVGDTERVWPLLKSSPNPRVRSFIIDRLALLGCNPDKLLARLETEKDDTIRAAIWLGLGHYDDKSLPEYKRSAIMTKLFDAYRQDESNCCACSRLLAHGQVGNAEGFPSVRRPDIREGRFRQRQKVVCKLHRPDHGPNHWPGHISNGPAAGRTSGQKI